MPLVDEDRTLLRRVADACDRLDRALTGHARKLGRLAWLAAVSLLVGFVGLIVGGLGVRAAAEANNSADDLAAFVADTEVERAQAKVSACVQFNVQRNETRGALKLGLRALAPPGTLTSAQQSALDEYGKAVDAQLPFRDCSPAGIEAYYRDPPKDPAVTR